MVNTLCTAKFGAYGRILVRNPASCRACILLGRPKQSVITSKRGTRRQPVEAHSSLLLPDVSPEANVPKHVADTILEYARAMPTWEVCVRAGVEVAVSVCLAFLVVKAIQKATDKAIHAHHHALSQEKNTTVINSIFRAALVALQNPVAALLPFLAAMHSLRVLALAGEVLLTVGGHRATIQSRELATVLSKLSLFLQSADSITGRLTEVVVIQFVVWFFLAFKEQIVNLVMNTRPDEDGSSKIGLERILTPISSLAGWVMVVAGVLSSVQVMGINVQPLLAVGGVSGIAIGFGAQSVSANAITGINLFVSRPFVVGDRVELRTAGGASVVTGLVERIAPMSTTVRNDHNIPISIPNKSVGDMIVVNESRVGRSAMQDNFKDPRLLVYSLRIRYDDASKVNKITDDIRAFFESHPGVDHKLPYKAALSDLATYSVDISITVHTTAKQSRSYSSFKSELLAELLSIIDRNGAKLAYPTSVSKT